MILLKQVETMVIRCHYTGIPRICYTWSLEISLCGDPTGGGFMLHSSPVARQQSLLFFDVSWPCHHVHNPYTVIFLLLTIWFQVCKRGHVQFAALLIPWPCRAPGCQLASGQQPRRIRALISGRVFWEHPGPWVLGHVRLGSCDLPRLPAISWFCLLKSNCFHVFFGCVCDA